MFPAIFRKSTQNRTPSLRVDATDRIYAVGDIHGRIDLLNALMEKISKDIKQVSDNRRPRIIFLGDYIDRGDCSRDVLEVLNGFAAMRASMSPIFDVQFDFLAGNHEIAMLNFLQDPVIGSAWINWGGLQTLSSFGIQAAAGQPSERQLWELRNRLARATEPFMAFLSRLQRVIVSGNVAFVHAGLDPTAPLGAQPDEVTLWGNAPSGRKLGLPGYRMVHGHFASYEPVSCPDRVCVDTGAYFSGRLTAVRLDEGESFLHADAADLLKNPAFAKDVMPR